MFCSGKRVGKRPLCAGRTFRLRSAGVQARADRINQYGIEGSRPDETGRDAIKDSGFGIGVRRVAVIRRCRAVQNHMGLLPVHGRDSSCHGFSQWICRGGGAAHPWRIGDHRAPFGRTAVPGHGGGEGRGRRAGANGIGVCRLHLRHHAHGGCQRQSVPDPHVRGIGGHVAHHPGICRQGIRVVRRDDPVSLLVAPPELLRSG